MNLSVTPVLPAKLFLVDILELRARSLTMRVAMRESEKACDNECDNECDSQSGNGSGYA